MTSKHGLVGEPVASRWRAQALLWHSQLDPEDRRALWQSLRVAWDLEAEPAVLRVRGEDGAPVSIYESLPWPPDDRPARVLAIPTDIAVPSESTLGRDLRLSAFVQTAYDVREHLYTLVPYWKSYGRQTVVAAHNDGIVSSAAALLELLLAPTVPDGDIGRRFWLYEVVFGLVGPGMEGPVLRQLLCDAIHLSEGQIKDIIGMSQRRGEQNANVARLVFKLSEVTRGWSTPEELTEAIKTLSRRDLVTFVMTMLKT